MKDLSKVCIDAQQMNKENPNSFQAPIKSELKRLVAGDIVKICIAPERFWVIIEKVDGENIIGIVDNDLIYTDEHGVKFKDKIMFQLRHVYSID